MEHQTHLDLYLELFQQPHHYRGLRVRLIYVLRIHSLRDLSITRSNLKLKISENLFYQESSGGRTQVASFFSAILVLLCLGSFSKFRLFFQKSEFWQIIFITEKFFFQNFAAKKF